MVNTKRYMFQGKLFAYLPKDLGSLREKNAPQSAKSDIENHFQIRPSELYLQIGSPKF